MTPAALGLAKTFLCAKNRRIDFPMFTTWFPHRQADAACEELLHHAQFDVSSLAEAGAQCVNLVVRIR
jgi:hypothetical protein